MLTVTGQLITRRLVLLFALPEFTSVTDLTMTMMTMMMMDFSCWHLYSYFKPGFFSQLTEQAVTFWSFTFKWSDWSLLLGGPMEDLSFISHPISHYEGKFIFMAPFIQSAYRSIENTLKQDTKKGHSKQWWGMSYYALIFYYYNNIICHNIED